LTATGKTNPLTGSQYQIAAGEYRATVTELGAGLRQLTRSGRPVITGYEPDELPPGAAGQLLAPWPNRVDHGQYVFAGAQHQLDLSEPGQANAIHGLTRWASWAPVDHQGDRVVLAHSLLGRPGYPFCLRIEAGYRLDPADGLKVTITVRNEGSGPAPYGTGSHPYLTAQTPRVDDCSLILPAGRWLPAGARDIPCGPAEDVTGGPFDFRRQRRIGGTSINHAFTALERDGSGRAWAWLSAGRTEVGLWAGDGYHWLQVFTGDTLPEGHRRRALAIEPMTCPPNALATGEDLLVLDPGGSASHSWGILAREA
jgi:aldose 1-epimerase